MKCFRTILLATLFLICLSSSLFAADWPTRGRTMARHAYVPEDLPLDQGKLHLKWKRFFGERIEVEMEPTVVGNTVYVGIMNGKLYALNKDTGVSKWVFAADGPISDTPTLFYVDSQLRIVFGALDGKVYCLNGNDGTKQWDYQTGGPVMSTPSVYNGKVFVGSLDKTFYALNGVDGTVAWTYETAGPISCTSALGAVGSGQYAVFFATGNNVAYGIRTDGTLLWTKQMHGAFTKRTRAVYGQGAAGKKVAIFVTRKPGRDYSEPMENLPTELQGSRKDGATVLSAWANYYQQYPRRRPLYFYDAVTGDDLWQGTKYTPLCIPYWGEYTPIVDDEGFAWIPGSGSGGDHTLDHDIRLWKVNLETGNMIHAAYQDQWLMRFDEVGRGTLVNERYFQALSEDIGYYEVNTGTTNSTVFGNGFGNHRKPLEFSELPDTTIFGGMHKHFTRFGSSGPAGFGGANDATSALVVAGNEAFITVWGHLYALSSVQTSATKDYMDLDLTQPLPFTVTREQVRQMLQDAIEKIVDDNAHLDPVSRMWVDTVSDVSDTVYWHMGETIRTLAQTLDYLDEPLKTELKTYLKREIQNYLLNSSYYAFRKACIDYDSGQVLDPCEGTGISASWYWCNKHLIAERIYAIYQYAEKANDWSLISDNWNFIVQTMYGGIKSDWDSEAKFFLWPEWLSGHINFNKQLGAMYAMKQMAQHLGDTTTQNEASSYYNAMLEGRVTWGNYVRNLYDSGQLTRNNYDNWEDWGYDQGVSPMPEGGYLDQDNDYRQPYSITRTDGSLVVGFSNKRSTYPLYLVGFSPLYPELTDLVKNNFQDHINDFIKAVEIYNPWWYLGDWGHQVAAGLHEDDSFSERLASDIFQAKAYIRGNTFEELAPLLPLAFEDYGYRDIFRLQNLVALLQAESSGTTLALGVSIPSTANESDGTLAGQGSVTVSSAPDSNLTVSLSSNDTSEITVPSAVTIPAGSTSTTFDPTIVDDTDVDGSITVTVTAAASGCMQGTDTITITDNDQPITLTVSVPQNATEGAGTLTGQGSVSVSASLGSDLSISLSSGDTTEVTVPSSVTLSAGDTSVSFDLTVIDDSLSDGTQTVAVTASAADCTSGSDTIAIADNDQQSSSNMLQNGDFETGQISPWQETTDASVSQQAAYDGNYGISIPSAQMPFQRWITVVPGKTYVYSGWFKWTTFSGSGWGYDTFNVSNDNWETVASINNLHNLYPQNEWQKLAVTFTATTTRVQVNFGVYGPQDNVELFFDELKLVEKTGNMPPVASPSASATSGAAPLSIQFSANASDPDGAIATYRWDFGDGGVSMLQNPSHSFEFKGTYTVGLTVWDNEGTATTQTLGIEVLSDNNPTVTISGPTAGNTYTTSASQVSLSGTATALSGRQITSVVWDNISTDEAGLLSITPAATVNWNTESIPLKPGENEILLTITDSASTVSTDRLIVTRSFTGPVISNISIPKATVNVYDKFEIRFDVDTVAEKPFFQYDENPPSGITPKQGITVEGVFTSPSGQVLRQPGFFFREVTRTGSGPTGHYQETANTYWMVRFAPLETGEYSASLTAKDASGTVSVAAGNFSALAPTKKGFVRVSENDPRYFEFENGDLFFPTGPAWGPDYATYKDTGINLERPWMAGQGAYSTNWSRWIRTGTPMGNEGIESPLTYKERYPSHELSRELFYPEANRIWMGLWGDEEFYPNMKPDTNYLIKLRIKTIDIAGPVNASYPYGLMLKSHGFPTETLEEDLRDDPSMIPVINTNRDWHTVLATYHSTTQDGTNQYLSLYLDNVNSGHVYIDQFSMKEIMPDGTTGGELIRHSKSDMHTYVEQRPAAYFDWQVQQGEQNGVYFKYVVQDKNDWVPNHLAPNGVFQDSGDGYFQEDGTKAKWLMQQWWRYLIARWGYSTAVHSWELCNEADPSSPAVYRQTQDFAKFMHDNDVHPHLVTTSFWCCWKPEFWGDRSNYPDVDYADLHEYTRDSELGLDMAEWIIHWAETTNASPVGMPVILAETGIGESGIGLTYFDYLVQPNPGVWYHNLLWAQLTAGSGLSAPNYWYSQHFNLIDRKQIAQPFSQFIGRLDVNKGGYQDLSVVVSNSDIRAIGQKNMSLGKAYLWIQNRRHNWHNVMGVENPETVGTESGIVTFQMSPNSDYTVQQWNTYTGSVQSTNTIQSAGNGDLSISVENLSSDVALYIKSLASAPDPPTGFRIVQ